MIAATCSTLIAVLKSAAAGAVIGMAPGPCVTPTIININPSSPITVTSQDPTAKAVLIGFRLGNSSNLIFSNLEMTFTPQTDPYYVFRMSNVKNVTFTKLDVHGDKSVAPSAQRYGFYLLDSQNVTFSNSSFSYMNAALIANRDDGLIFQNNVLSHLSKGGVEMGATSNVLFADNLCTNFNLSVGTHSDCIQAYTSGLTTAGHDIQILRNTFSRGSGDPIQGIFIQDEVGTMPYSNLTISGNHLLGGYWNAIWVYNATGNLTVTNNFVYDWPGIDMAKGANVTTGFQANIVLQKVVNARLTMTGNAAQGYLGENGKNIGLPVGNTLLPAS